MRVTNRCTKSGGPQLKLKYSKTNLMEQIWGSNCGTDAAMEWSPVQGVPLPFA